MRLPPHLMLLGGGAASQCGASSFICHAAGVLGLSYRESSCVSGVVARASRVASSPASSREDFFLGAAIFGLFAGARGHLQGPLWGLAWAAELLLRLAVA